MKILILPKYHREGSSSRYRYYNYVEWLLQSHYSVTARPLLYDGYVMDMYHNRNRFKRTVMQVVGILARCWYMLRNKRKFDVIIIEKELVTFMPLFIEKWLLSGCRFIVDYDDNIHARYQAGWARFFLANKIPQMARLANAVTVGNKWYLQLFTNIDPSNIHYLPTVIDQRRYEKTVHEKKANQPLKIIWIGSPATVAYLNIIDSVVVRLQLQYNVVLVVMGAVTPLACRAVFEKWTEETEIVALQQGDIGIMPLQNSEWEKGKCGLKLIQYMACGLPVVASYSIANSDIIGNHSGFIADTAEQWYNYLSMLLTSADLRQQMGNHARARVHDHFTYQVWAPVFMNLIKSVGVA